MLGSNSDYLPIPTTTVWKQYIHLQMLAKLGLIKSSQTLITGTTENVDMVENRRQRLEQFIDSHDALSNDVPQSAFVLGGLVGRMSSYQSNHLELSKTVASQYPVDSLTASRFEVVVQEVIDKTREYSEMQDGMLLFSRYTDRIVETALQKSPEKWGVTTSEIRYYYSLGLAYGYSDTPIQDDSDDEDIETNTVAD